MKFCKSVNIWSAFCYGLFLVVGNIFAAPGDKYKGDKVVEMIAGSKATASMMKEFIVKNDRYVDVWTQTPLKCQVRISSEKVDELRNFNRRWNITMKVQVEDLKEFINRQVMENVASPKMAKNPKHRPSRKQFNYEQYNKFDDIRDELYRLQCNYPNLIDLVKVGYSFEGRPLIIAKITDNVSNDCKDQKKIIWIDGGTHGREWISVASAMYIVRELLTKYSTNSNVTKLLKNNAVYVVPVLNPDGYVYSFIDRLWRKSRTPIPGSKCVGIDPNRNWNAMWGGEGSSSDPCSELYRGTEPESEPVVKQFANVLRFLQKRIKAFWTFHSFAQVLLYPNSYTSVRPGDFEKFARPALTFLFSSPRKFGRRYFIGNTIQRLGQTLTGVSIDWTHDTLGIPFSYLIELPPPMANPVGFLLPASEIAPTSQEVFCSILDAMVTVDMVIAQENAGGAPTNVPSN